MDSSQWALQTLLSPAAVLRSDLLIWVTSMRVKCWNHSLKTRRRRVLAIMIVTYLLKLGFPKATNIEGGQEEWMAIFKRHMNRPLRAFAIY